MVNTAAANSLKNKSNPTDVVWSVPYIDQPGSFWEELHRMWGSRIRDVYFPLFPTGLSSGRPVLPPKHLDTFLEDSALPKCALMNSIVTSEPVEVVAERAVRRLKELNETTDLVSVTLVDLRLAERIREALPDIEITASVLMDINRPGQVIFLEGLVDCVVPAGSIMRDLKALKKLRSAFQGRLKIIVNEACLAGCPWRTQHFYDMSRSVADQATRFEELAREKPWLALSEAGGYCRTAPRRLCADFLDEKPWMRLTGAWVLPQHLSFYNGLVDSFKLAGRISLRNPDKYRRVLEAYLTGKPLKPHEIGGGPAAPEKSVEISDEFYRTTLYCDRNCGTCGHCREYYHNGVGP